MLMYEMLVGVCPFEGENKKETMAKVMKSTIEYPDSLSSESISLLQGLLKRNPVKRFGSMDGWKAEEIKRHVFFDSINWSDLYQKTITPPFKPTIIPDDIVSNFESTFTSKAPLNSPGTPPSATAHVLFRGFSYVAPSLQEEMNEVI